MTVWIWVLSILFVLFLLTLVRLRLVVRYDGKLSLEFSYLFLRLKIPSRMSKMLKGEGEKKKKSEAETGGKKTGESSAAKKKPDGKQSGERQADKQVDSDEQAFRNQVNRVLDTAKKTFAFSKKLLTYVRRKLTCEKLQLHMQIGAGDAAATAISTGSMWAFLYTAYGALERFFTVPFREPDLAVTPLYNENRFEFQFCGIFSIRVVNIIVISTRSLIYILFHRSEKK